MVVVKKSIVFSMLLFFDKRNGEGKRVGKKLPEAAHSFGFIN